MHGHTFLAVLLILLLAFAVVTVYLLERYVLGRIAALSTAVAYIGETGDPAARLPAEAQDGTSSITEKVMPSVCTQCGRAV